MSTRVAARVARRDVLRRRGRTALVALLVALPVAGMVVAFVLQRTGDGTAEDAGEQHEQQDRDEGAARVGRET